MKKLSLGFLAAACWMQPAYASTEFIGAVCATSVSSACAGVWYAGDCFTSRYAPRGVGDNGQWTKLSLFWGQYAIGFQANNVNPISKKPIPIQAAKVAGAGYMFDMAFRFTEQSPSIVTNSTNNLTLTGTFNDWDGIRGCSVDFRGSYTRKTQ